MKIDNMAQTLRLREYYYMALRHKTWFFASVAAALIISVVIAQSSQKIYRAETVLMVESENMLTPLVSGLAIMPSAAVRMRAFYEQLLSWQRLTLLVEKLKLDKGVRSPLAYERLINKLREDIRIKIRGNDLVVVACENHEPKKAQEIVQTLSDIIVGGTITSAGIEANSAISFIKQQMDEYKKKLEDSEARLREFKEVYNSTLPIATRMNEQLVSAKLELNNLMVENTEVHPRVIYFKKLIVQLEGQRDQYFDQAKKMGLDLGNEEYAKLISSVPLQEQRMTQLQRDYNVNAQIYQTLLSRLETAKISQTLESADKGVKFRILEPARLPLRPVKPNKLLILLGGLVSGAILGIVLVYLRELSDNSIKNVDEAHQLFDLPIFGAIATIHTEELLLGERLKTEGAHV